MIVVIKIGGAAGINQNLTGLANDLKSLVDAGNQILLIHGGSAEVDALGERLGVPMRYITSPSGVRSRYTDSATMEVFIMAMAGRVNTELVRQLQVVGVKAVGITAISGGMFYGERKTAIRSVEGSKVKLIRDDLSATLTSVDTALVEHLLAGGYLPVVCPLVLAQGGEVCNIDADRAAAALATALRADQLILLSNVPGLLEDVSNPSSLIRCIRVGEAESYEEIASAGMKKKLAAAVAAVRSGVKRAVIADGRVEAPATRAIRSEGTVVTP
ncbi:MAG TPA: [LysW]-aminoadipate kinase [Firmicutes bacterium]|nr:[LysW]-aminoadipate kinase [Bacillota bacterium]